MGRAMFQNMEINMRNYVCLRQEIAQSGSFKLMTVQDAHIDLIRQWRNAQMDVLRQSEPISPEEQIRYYNDKIWPSLALRHPENILLSFLEDDLLVGYGGFVHIAWNHWRAEISFLLDPALTCSDEVYAIYFSAYLKLLKKIAFENLKFHRLYTETYAIRRRHIDVLEDNGFILEGRMRDHVRIDSKPTDSLIHGCLNNNIES